jgi:hypothetical protein
MSRLARKDREEIIKELEEETTMYEIGKVIASLQRSQSLGADKISAMYILETAWSTK